MPDAITSRAIREIERKAGDLPPWSAGRAAADMAAELCAGKDVLVLAGPGNNGGDARIAAARLEESFFRVVVSHLRELPHDRSWDS
jgi:NAD(P)H-hydrate repair Nnr-like enzyme with NAD(P)H-hydrate epimerase domain